VVQLADDLFTPQHPIAGIPRLPGLVLPMRETHKARTRCGRIWKKSSRKRVMLRRPHLSLHVIWGKKKLTARDIKSMKLRVAQRLAGEMVRRFGRHLGDDQCAGVPSALDRGVVTVSSRPASAAVASART